MLHWGLHYYPSVRIMKLLSTTTNVVCVNFMDEWSNLGLKSSASNSFFGKLSMAILCHSSEFLPKILREKVTEEIFFHISFC